MSRDTAFCRNPVFKKIYTHILFTSLKILLIAHDFNNSFNKRDTSNYLKYLDL